jgi:3-hydroxybutyryl-CoA dehydrogenase
VLKTNELNLITSPRTIGICGIGQIGLALSLASWRSGYRVLLYGRNVSKLDNARIELARMNDWLNSEFPEQTPRFGEIQYQSDLEALDRDAELVIEGIAEDMAAKVALWRTLARAARRGAVFCSATSGLSISEMGRQSGCPAQLVGTHFWNPPHLMPLVEVVAGAETAETTIETAITFCRNIGKHPVRVNIDAPGFIGNRMLHALWREAIDIVERGIATAEDVDQVARMTFGLRMPVLGPLENMDLVGLDLIRTIHGYMLSDLARHTAPGKLLETRVQERCLGMKTGSGFYDWRQRDAQMLIEARDRQIVRELKRLAHEATLQPRPVEAG